MEFFTTTVSAERRSGSCVLVGIYEDGVLGIAAEAVDRAGKGALAKLVKSGDLPGRTGSASLLHAPAGAKSPRVLVVGLGRKGALNPTRFRKAVAQAAKVVKESHISDVVSYLSLEPVDGRDAYYLARDTVETVLDSLYRYSATKSGRKPRRPALKKFGIAAADRSAITHTRRGIEHASAIAGGVEFAKELGNLPPNICTPAYLARSAQKIARRHKTVSAKILNEKEIRKLGMHSFLSVTAGTALPARLIVLHYRGAGDRKPIVFIGKGITFDAGGISLKPGPGMDEMKFDMCGAASVMAALDVAARLALPVNLTVVVPACENLPSGAATRPGDIVTSMSGKTIEILNTDAEGRLIMCDALTYARRFKPAVVIDVATLTGACVIALGHHLTAIMSRSDDLAAEIAAAGIAAEDRGWRLPLADEYERQLKSNFADFANVGGREGGAITAGCFLGKFTKGLEWAHLDIAGTAWRSGPSKGSTGRPVPMLSEFLLRRAGATP